MPEFWSRADSRAGAWLAPLGRLYDLAGRLRSALVKPERLPVPVICVGNLTAGGAGKTPTALAVAQWFRARGRRPHFLTRGYGGQRAGPLLVDPKLHDFRAVGDEALLLAAAGPTWVARDRRAGARAAVAAGADLIIMDDGLQNPSLAKDLSLLVIDAGFGLGNGRMIPAGPLREPLARALGRVQAVIVIGHDDGSLAAQLGGALPVLAGRLTPEPRAQALRGKKVVAFAGIGRPAKFFATLAELGCSLVATKSFADHHVYDPDELMELVELASMAKALPVTTDKDFMRLPPEARQMFKVCRVALEWRDEAALERILRPLLQRPSP
jgi:tetraacyldisaccharide 4'-kinase